jgi:hypothetical protein
MPARVTVYCHKSVAHVTAQEIREDLQQEDWHTFAEIFDVEDEEIVNVALSYFQIVGEMGISLYNFVHQINASLR